MKDSIKLHRHVITMEIRHVDFGPLRLWYVTFLLFFFSPYVLSVSRYIRIVYLCTTMLFFVALGMSFFHFITYDIMFIFAPNTACRCLFEPSWLEK